MELFSQLEVRLNLFVSALLCFPQMSAGGAWRRAAQLPSDPAPRSESAGSSRLGLQQSAGGSHVKTSKRCSNLILCCLGLGDIKPTRRSSTPLTRSCFRLLNIPHWMWNYEEIVWKICCIIQFKVLCTFICKCLTFQYTFLLVKREPINKHFALCMCVTVKCMKTVFPKDMESRCADADWMSWAPELLPAALKTAKQSHFGSERSGSGTAQCRQSRKHQNTAVMSVSRSRWNRCCCSPFGTVKQINSFTS